MEVTALPRSDNAKTILSTLMENDQCVDIERAKDGEVYIVSHNGKFSAWTPLKGDDWEIILPSVKLAQTT
jgi:hypothetical protein